MNENLALVGARTDQGPFRSHNEDAYWVSDAQTPTELGALYIVADGVGGQEHGDVAAQQAVQVVSEAFYRLRRSGLSIPEALHDAILEANKAVYDHAQARGGGKMGCTLVAAVQHEGKLHVAHVGDARAYLLLENRLRRLTRDDTWVQKQVDAGVITTEEAENHELRNIVTQVLGNKLDITVHLSSVQDLHAGDIFLLCSDGLHGVLTNKQLYRLMKDNPPQAAADKLVEAAIKNQTKDNVTAVVVNSGLSVPGNSPFVVAAPPRSHKKRLPLWASVTLGTIVVLLIGFAAYALFSSDNVSLFFGGGGETVEGETAPVMTDTAVPPSAAPVVQPPTPIPSTATAPPPTAPPPTTTSAPTDTPPPLPTSTPIPPKRGCVTAYVLVWEDFQLNNGQCDQVTSYELNSGDEVLILDDAPRSVRGPGSMCNLNEFIKVQSTSATPEVIGWAIRNAIQILEPGEDCQP